jgi:mediator of RNA polymerase II transcription subunit 12, fungi type
LDRDHYLDWIVKSISSASLDALPIWLLLAHLHTADMIKHRKRGRQFVASLLEKLCSTTERGESIFAPLVARLKHMLGSIMRISLSYFVMPQSWRRYKSSVEKCLDLNSPADQRLLEQLSHKHERLSTPSDLDSSESRTPRQLMILILDSAIPPFNACRIAQDCQSVCGNTDLFVKVVLEWCSSRFRTGKYRVYLAVRLLKISHAENDINTALVDFLASQQKLTSCDAGCLRLLISELIQSQVFSLSRYLQWLTARGGLPDNPLQTCSSSFAEVGNERSNDSTGFHPVQVLTAVPLSSLSPAVRNLRNILLDRAAFSIEHEAIVTETCKCYIASQLPTIFKYDADPSAHASVPDFAALSWSVKFEIALFLKQNVLSSRASGRGSASKDSGQALPLLAITDVEFCLIRSFCEDMGDLSVLADIIKICIASDDEKLLASITDTVNFHLDAFSALGVFAELHSRLFRTYLSMRASHGLPRQFLVSLISLGSIISSNLVSVSLLQQDLARGDRNLAVAACSPVSDGMAESLQQAGQAFTEEFEAVLSTGNRMEEQTMAQLFNVLADRLEKGYYQTEAENDEILCALHARLRIYRIAQFDTAIEAWLQRLFTTAKSRLEQLLPILISTSCISFDAYAEILVKVLVANENISAKGLLVRSHLTSFLAIIKASEAAIDPVSYKLKLENARQIKKSPHLALELRTRTELSDDRDLERLSNDLLIHLVLKEEAQEMVSLTRPAETVTSVLDNLLQLPEDGSNLAFPELVKITNDLSMPFCRIRLQIWAAANSLSSLAAGPEAVIDSLFDLAKSRRDNAWIQFTTALGQEAACRVREKAEEAFFALPIFSGPGRQSMMSPFKTCIEQANNYLRVIAQTPSSIPAGGVQAVFPTLVERFAVVLRGLITGRVLASHDNIKQTTSHPASPIEESTPGNLDHLTAYLTVLLQMTSIHRSAYVSSRAEPLSSPVAPPKQNQQDMVKMLVLLTNIALHPLLDGVPGVVSHIFDVAATIVDDASDEVRMLCARILKDKMRDPRAESLFGSANNTTKGIGAGHENCQTGWTTDGLQIVKDGKRGGEYRARNWEMLEGGTEASVSLSLFDTRREV